MEKKTQHFNYSTDDTRNIQVPGFDSYLCEQTCRPKISYQYWEAHYGTKKSNNLLETIMVLIT